MKQVCILMSTYNGEYFLQQQLDSLDKQEGEFQLYYYIRDDGSTDGTRDIIRSWIRTHQGKAIFGNNIGVKESFLWLMRTAPPSDFYAFCDQDDLWDKKKLKQQIAQFNDKNIPQLCYCAQMYIDAQGNPTEEGVRCADNPHMTFENSFVYNWAPGCTQVWNHELMEKIQRCDIRRCVMHDMIPIHLAGIYGEIVFEPTPLLYYRQHQQNVTTARTSLTKRIKLHWQVWIYANGCSLQEQAQELLEKTVDIPANKYNFLVCLASYKKNFRNWVWLWSGNVKTCGGWRRNFSFVVRVFLHLA